MMADRKHPPGEPMTPGNMRELGGRRLVGHCRTTGSEKTPLHETEFPGGENAPTILGRVLINALTLEGPLSGGMCCKTRLRLGPELGCGFLLSGSIRRDRRLTRRLGGTSGCDRRWGTAEELNEPPQILRGCGE